MPAENQILNNGRYQVQQQFPLNGQTAVYEAYDTISNANVVVKEITVQLGKVATAAQHDQVRSEFANQARILTNIRHDSLLHVHDYFSDVGRQYLVMEMVDGDHLGDALEASGVGFRLSEVMAWADQLLDALHYLHTFVPPIIHRNIRPQHIKLTMDGKVKLLAFGPGEGSSVRIDTNISAQSFETEIAYSPLEQIWDSLDPASQKVIINNFDERSGRALAEPLSPGGDIYSLGATLYHLLTGRKPVDALERAIDLLEGKSDPLKPVYELEPDVPPEISDVVTKAMSVKLFDRFDSAAIMRQVLKTAQIRAKEREAEEERDQAEAAAVLRRAAEKRKAGPAVANAPSTPVPFNGEERRSEVRRTGIDVSKPVLTVDTSTNVAQTTPADQAKQSVPRSKPSALLDSDLLEIPDVPLSVPVKVESPEALLAGIVPDDKPTPTARIQPERPLPPRPEPRTPPPAPPVSVSRFAGSAEDVPPRPEIRPSAIAHLAEQPVASEEAVEKPPTAAGPVEMRRHIGGWPELPKRNLHSPEPAPETSEPERPATEPTPVEPAFNTVSEVITEAAMPDAPALEPIIEEEPVTEEVGDAASFAAYADDLPSAPYSAVDASQELDDYLFSEVSHSRPAIPMPVIGAAAGLVLMVIIGAWMFLSSSSDVENPETSPQTSVTSAPPVSSSQEAVSEADVISAPVTSEPASAAIPAEQDQRAAEVPRTQSAQQQNAAKNQKKQPAAKQPEKKKSVTVDDLINDN